MRRAVTAAAAAALVATLLSGCTSVVPGTAQPAPRAATATATRHLSDSVQFADDVCGALHDFVDTTATMPALDGRNPAASLRTYSDHLSSVSESARHAIGTLRELDPSPIASGADVVAQLVAALTTMAEAADAARSVLAGADPADPRAVTSAILASVEQLEPMTTIDLSGLADKADYNAAATRAPECALLRAPR